MSPPSAAGAPSGAPAVGGRGLCVLVAAVLVSLLGLIAVLGVHTPAPAAATRADAGCTTHALRYGISDDAGQAAAQDRFERSGAAIPAPGFATAALPVTPALHAALHGTILIFARTGTAPHRMPGLDALMAYAKRTSIPMIVAPRPQQAALTVVRQGYSLSCSRSGAAQIAAVRRFAARQAGILIPPRPR